MKWVAGPLGRGREWTATSLLPPTQGSPGVTPGAGGWAGCSPPTPCPIVSQASVASATDPRGGRGQPGLCALLAVQPPAQLLLGRLCLARGLTAAAPEAPHPPQSRCAPHGPAQPAKGWSQGYRRPCTLICLVLEGPWAGTGIQGARACGSRGQAPAASLWAVTSVRSGPCHMCTPTPQGRQ